MKNLPLISLIIISIAFICNGRRYHQRSDRLRSAARSDYYNAYDDNDYLNDLYELEQLRKLRRKREVCNDLGFMQTTI